MAILSMDLRTSYSISFSKKTKKKVVTNVFNSNLTSSTKELDIQLNSIVTRHNEFQLAQVLIKLLKILPKICVQFLLIDIKL